MVRISNDHSTISNDELGAVILANPHPFGKSKCRVKPSNGLTHIAIDQNGDDSR